MKVCIVGASGKLGQYMVQYALDRDYEVVGVCREQSVAKLDAFKGRMTVIPGPTDDREVIKKAVAGCDGVLTVLVPRGMHGYSTGTAQAVLDLAPPAARLVFSCGWHITRDGQDGYSRRLKWKVRVLGGFGKLVRAVDRGPSRPLGDNTAGIETWPDAGETSHGGYLTRKQSPGASVGGINLHGCLLQSAGVPTPTSRSRRRPTIRPVRGTDPYHAERDKVPTHRDIGPR